MRMKTILALVLAAMLAGCGGTTIGRGPDGSGSIDPSSPEVAR